MARLSLVVSGEVVMRALVYINFKSQQDAFITLGQDLPEQSNVSRADLIVNGNSSGFRGVQATSGVTPASTTLDGTWKFFADSGYPGFLSKSQANATGNITLDIPFTLSGVIPDTLYIVFDAASGEYAQSFTLYDLSNNKSVSVSNNTATVVAVDISTLVSAGVVGTYSMRLRITKWSKPNGSVKITRLSTSFVAAYTGTNLIKVTCSENLLDAQLSVTTGLCEQYAEAVLYDRDGILRSFAVQGKLTQDNQLDVYAVSNDGSQQVLIGSYLTSFWQVDSNSSEVTVNCYDRSHAFSSYNFIPPSIKDRTCEDMLNEVFTQGGNVPWTYQDNSTKNRCRDTITPNSWFESSTVAEALDKVCQFGLLRVYWRINTFVVSRWLT